MGYDTKIGVARKERGMVGRRGEKREGQRKAETEGRERTWEGMEREG